MSKRVRNRQQRSRSYYRVIRPNGTKTVISARQFAAAVAAGNLVRDENDIRLARVRKRFTFAVDERTRELIFQPSRRCTVTAPTATGVNPGRTKNAGPRPYAG